MIVDSDDKVVALNWEFTNEVGQVRNQLVLRQPAGGTALSDVTKEKALDWLEDQLEATAADLTKAIADHKTKLDYEASLRAYTANSGKAPTKVEAQASAEPGEKAEELPAGPQGPAAAKEEAK